MSKIEWIKLKTDMFDDEKIKVIESLPEADAILVIWIKLLTLAGRTNQDGFLILHDRIPYTPEMLSTILGRPLNTVRLALSTFEKFGMVTLHNGVLLISNWGKHQNIDGLDKVREQTKLRVQKHREKQEVTAQAILGNATVTLRNGTELEKREKKEELKDNPDDTSLADHIFSLIKILHPSHRQPDIKDWANDIRLMRERDQRTHDEIRSLFEWANADSFWKTNILSPAKLRHQWDRLIIQRLHGGKHHAADQRINTDVPARIDRAHGIDERSTIAGDSQRLD